MFPLLLLALAADVPSMQPPDQDIVMQAMRKTLAARPDLKDANLEIVEMSHFPAPAGEMEFDWKNLIPPAAGQSTARWRGVIRRDVDHTFSIWAVVRLTVPCKRIIAAETIRPDVPISESQLHEEAYEGFPSEVCDSSIRAMIGKVATRILSTNTAVIPSMLAAPSAVLKGDQVIAVYRENGVSLTLPVIVERSGRIGETIAVRNPVSHKLLLAQVIGEGKVQVGDKQ